MRTSRLAAVVGSMIMLSACAPSFVQDKAYFNDLGTAPQGMMANTKQSDPVATKALSEIDKSKEKYGKNDQVQLGMDLGMALHVDDNYQKSEKVFQKTNHLIKDLYTKSLSDILLAYQVNDYELPYRGLPYERVMINLLNSLNYAASGDWSGALVESRKIRRKLLEYNRMYAKSGGKVPGKFAQFEGQARGLLAQHKIEYNPSQLNHYTDDAFARYLSGVYEEAEVESGAGNYQSAYLSYVKSAKVYQTYHDLYHTPIPSFLGPALLRTAEAAGRTRELRKWKRIYKGTPYTHEAAYQKMGHILFIGMNGEIFHLDQQKFIFPLPIDNTISMLSFSLPKTVGGGTDVIGHEIDLTLAKGSSPVSVSSELGDDLMAIGNTNFNDHLKRIVLREAIRSTLKTVEQIAAQQAAKRAGGWAELGTMIAGGIAAVASDQADTRSWRLLPATVDFAPIDLPPGTYDLVIKTKTATGQGGVVKERVTVTSGQYLLIRTVNVPPVIAKQNS